MSLTTAEITEQLVVLRAAQVALLTGKRVTRQQLEGVGLQEFQTATPQQIRNEITRLEAMHAGSHFGSRGWRRGTGAGKNL